ncbi:MAG TPA: hypothetical protein PKH65_07070, partial [Bacteroidia bacterium]|nr:hypothetical protein [Bacteroidia bacterium]
MKKQLLRNGKAKQIVKHSLAIMFLFMSATYYSIAQTYLPSSYWTFNNPSAVNRDSMNNVNLDFSTYNCQYTVVGGVSGKAIDLDNNVSIINAGTFAPDTGFTIEFWFKPGYKFNQCYLFQRLDGAMSAFFSYPNLKFTTSTKTTGGQVINDELSIQLDGLGRKAYDYYMDGNWHHMVFKYTASNGKKEVWVDGQNPSGFSKTITASNVNNPGSSNKTLIFEHTVSYVKFYGGYDEIAIYKSPIPSKMIYNHYQQGLAGQSYSFNVPNITVPSADPISGPIDIMEYAPGHPNVSVSAISQLSEFPLPRYKTGHGLLPNFNWMNPQYFGGLSQPGVNTSQAISNSSTIILELAKNWNYYLTVNDNTTSCWNYNNLNTFQGAWVKLANDNPQYPAAAISFWAQTRPSDIGRPSSTPYIWAKNLQNSFYLKNSSGQFLDINGNVTSNKIWSPASSMDSVYWDGRTQKMYLEKLVQKLTRPLDIINENAEVIPLITQNGLQADPSVVSDKNASGMNWTTYQGDRKARFSTHYRDQFMNTIPALANTKFTEYAIDGQPTWRHSYAESRSINTPINGQYYATPDFYPRWPHNWRYWSSAWHGWQWIVESRVNELAVGDKLYSPFVSAGWDNNEENNMRPAQWLGLLKVLGVTGAEFYYTGFFNLAAPFPKPQDYTWQAVMPAYSQAITSRYEDILRNGDLLAGDVPNSYSNPTAPGYAFWAGDMSKLVVARKHSSQNKYVISGTIQPVNNMAGSTQLNDVANVTIDGNNLKFNVRRQGSTYIYDRTVSTDPVFYQIDTWHENSHPSYWSKEFELEAELFDNNNNAVKLKTKLPSGTSAGDYTNYTTYVTYPTSQSTATVLEYNFTPRTSQQGTLYLWVRAKSKTGNATGLNISLDGGAAKSIGCITDTAWTWYRYDACTQQAISFTNLQLSAHKLSITAASTDLELDKFILTTNANLGLNNNPPVCSASSATITANGTTNLCSGQTVQLTASAGISYLWSNGATTSSINTGTAGNYVVTVSAGNGCNAVSNPVAVTVSSANATITANGATSFCQGSQVQLSANNGSSYLWSNGQTTKNINVNSSGSFSVQVTQSGGCTATSSVTNVTVYANPTASITANGPTTFCSGSSVLLTATGGNSYAWNNGSSGSTLSVSSAGLYSATVTNVNGCTAISNSINVVVNNNSTPTISSSGTTSNLCPGDIVTLTATNGQSYLWSTGETAQ